VPTLAAGPDSPLGLEQITVLAGLFIIYLLEPGCARGTGASTAAQHRHYIYSHRAEAQAQHTECEIEFGDRRLSGYVYDY